MPTEFESIIRQVTADYRASRGLPPLASDMTVPASVREKRSDQRATCGLCGHGTYRWGVCEWPNCRQREK